MKHKIWTFSLAIISLLIFWQLGSMALDKPFLPTPLASFQAFFQALATGEINVHFWISAYRIFISIVIAFVLAVPLGLFIGRSQLADKLLSPMIYVLYPLPKVVFLPIIVVLMGLGDLPKIFLITLVIFFQIVVATRDSAKSIPYASLQSMRSLNASGWQIYRHLIFPYCLPQILSALRVSLGIAIAILFFAETFASTNGLGYYILDSMERRDYAFMYGGIIAMGLLGIIAYKIVDWIEGFACRWQKY